jgi:hypothetical protein
MLLAACSQGKREEPAPGFEPVSGAGFTVHKPIGWTATAVSPTRFVVESPDRSAMAAITAMPLRADALELRPPRKVGAGRQGREERQTGEGSAARRARLGRQRRP